MKNKIFISAVIVVIAFCFFFSNAKKSSNSIGISQIIYIASASAEEASAPAYCIGDEKDVTKTIGCMDGSKEECDLCEEGDTDCSPGNCCDL